jgi:phosphatidylserine/phosphatidylglycerophosphate/cardiolipin synthase-like enzyme
VITASEALSLLENNGSMDISNELIMVEYHIREAIKYAITNNKAKITIITNYNDNINDTMSLCLSQSAAAYYVELFNSENIKLIGYDKKGITMHDKFMIADKTLIFGSYNFDVYSYYINREYIIKLSFTDYPDMEAEFNTYIKFLTEQSKPIVYDRGIDCLTWYCMKYLCCLCI